MSQNQVTGASANLWGRETARKIADELNAKMVSKNSNECILQNNHAVIKCAKVDTNSVGVTYNMLERIDFIIGAFQTENGCFELYRLPTANFKMKMRATASKGNAKGKVGIVRKSVFESQGITIGSLSL
jgi:hypothetical protein